MSNSVDSHMKAKLIQALLNDDDNVDMMDALQSLLNELPQGGTQYKVLSNLHFYLACVQDDEEQDLVEDLTDGPALMAAASLRAMGLIGDTSRDENIASLILQSALTAWAINKDAAKSILN